MRRPPGNAAGPARAGETPQSAAWWASSGQKQELVAVEQHTPQQWQSAFPHNRRGTLNFAIGGLTAQGELKCTPHLVDRIITSVLLHSRAKRLCRVERESAVEQVERLNWREGFPATRCALAAIGAVEGAEHSISLTANFVCENHTSKSIDARCFD